MVNELRIDNQTVNQKLDSVSWIMRGLTFVVLVIALFLGVIAVVATPDEADNTPTTIINEDVNRETTGTGSGGGGIKYRFQ